MATDHSALIENLVHSTNDPGLVAITHAIQDLTAQVKRVADHLDSSSDVRNR